MQTYEWKRGLDDNKNISLSSDHISRSPESDHGSTEYEPPALGQNQICIDHQTKDYSCYRY